jgi:hypothetical protein
MNKPKIEEFLENHNMHFLFCLLANLEVARLNNLPTGLKQRFDKKITEVALDHVASNVIPDYIIEEYEEEVEEPKLARTFDDDDDDDIFSEDLVLTEEDADLEEVGDLDDYSDDEDEE